MNGEFSTFTLSSWVPRGMRRRSHKAGCACTFCTRAQFAGTNDERKHPRNCGRRGIHYNIRELLPSDGVLEARHQAAMRELYEVETRIMPGGVTYSVYRRRV